MAVTKEANEGSELTDATRRRAQYMDALYTKYLACCAPGKDGKGGRIASNTMPVIHLEQRRWRFENPGEPCLEPPSHMPTRVPAHRNRELTSYRAQTSTSTRDSPGSGLGLSYPSSCRRGS